MLEGHVSPIKVREGNERLWKGIEVNDRPCNVVEINICHEMSSKEGMLKLCKLMYVM